MKWEDFKKEIKSISSEEVNLIEGMADANEEPNPECEMCDGSGIVAMDDSMDGYSFRHFKCDCVKPIKDKTN